MTNAESRKVRRRIAAYAKTHTTHECVAKFATSSAKVYNSCREFGTTPVKDYCSAVNVDEAQQMFDSGFTLKAIGEKYGVTRERIRQKIDTGRHAHRRMLRFACLCGAEFLGAAGSRLCPKCEKARLACKKCGKERSSANTISGMCWTCCCSARRKHDYEAIVAAYRSGEPTTSIGPRLGMAPSAVWKVLRRCGEKTRTCKQAQVPRRDRMAATKG